MNDLSTREKILQAAGPIFADRGFRDSTVRDICDAAGVNLASINYYFGDKARLYIEAVRFARESQEGTQSFDRALNQVEPKESLYKFVRVLLRRLGVQREAGWQVQLLVREFMEPGDATRAIVEEYFRPYFDRLLALLDQLAPEPLDETSRTLAGFSILGQCLYYRVAGPMIRVFLDLDVPGEEPWTLDRLARHITEFSVSGLARNVENAPAPQPE